MKVNEIIKETTSGGIADVTTGLFTAGAYIARPMYDDPSIYSNSTEKSKKSSKKKKKEKKG